MKRIAIDMDDVICGGGFLNLVNEFLNTSYSKKDIKGYYIQDLIPEDKREEWNIFFKSKNMYEYVETIDDAVNVIEKLNKFYDVYILSAYILRDQPEHSGEFVKDKYNWLYKNLPFIDPNKYIFTTNKDTVNCDVRIDDKLSNLDGNAEIKMLFTSYHNNGYTKEELERKGVIRVNSWKEIEGILLK